MNKGKDAILDCYRSTMLMMLEDAESGSIRDLIRDCFSLDPGIATCEDCGAYGEVESMALVGGCEVCKECLGGRREANDKRLSDEQDYRFAKGGG